MHKIILFFALIAAAATIATGCDSGDTKSATVGSANGLLDDETAADTETETAADTAADDTAPTTSDDVANLGDDPAPSPLEVAWTDGAETSVSAVVSMQFEVRNVSDGTVSGSVRLLCSSVLDRNAALDLGAFEIGPGELQAFSIAATDLPIRSSSVLTQVAVEISRTYMKPGDVEGTAVTVEAPRFYRHEEGYDTAKAFTEKHVQDDLGGALFTAPSAFSSTSTPSESDAEDAMLGQVKNADDDGFHSVTMASEGIALRDEKGNVYAYLVGASFGVAEPPEIEATPVAESAEEEVAYE